MRDLPSDYRKYLDPRTLAKVGSLDLRARSIVEGMMSGAASAARGWWSTN